MSQQPSYECNNPPCIHVVVDYPRRRLAVFLETGDGEIIHIPYEKLRQACQAAEELLRRRFREAKGNEIDEIASQYLGAEPIEEE